MLHSSFNRSLALFLVVTIFFLLAGTTSIAQEKIKVAGTQTMAITQYESIDVSEADKHMMSFVVYDGFNESRGKQKFMDGAQVINVATSDLIKGTGTNHGYTRVTKGDDSILTKWKGKVTTKISEGGIPHISFRGTYSWISGTGRYKNVEGAGTYKGRFLSENIYTVDWEGEYSNSSTRGE